MSVFPLACAASVFAIIDLSDYIWANLSCEALGNLLLTQQKDSKWRDILICDNQSDATRGQLEGLALNETIRVLGFLKHPEGRNFANDLNSPQRCVGFLPPMAWRVLIGCRYARVPFFRSATSIKAYRAWSETWQSRRGLQHHPQCSCKRTYWWNWNTQQPLTWKRGG